MRILSGVQPTGKLHIGNYFGAIRQFVRLQDEPGNECFYFIADLHAMTTIREGGELRDNALSVATDFLALGLDPRRSVLYRQSDVPEVTELAWMLSTVTPMGLLQRCHSYKDKTARGITPNHGLFAYPVLMAADILIVRADKVPVGKDQKQHLEVTRDIAGAFNLAYGKELLQVPEELILPEVAVVPGTDGQKMSKSYGNTLDIF
ncbi:MAG TPA: tryptophan--tRNA ligase, partial [Thermoanaerobaculaceae bacterium]|nr:tryptophan--tRNA ligase [Thermoanaerobaculaceae bacterium]